MSAIKRRRWLSPGLILLLVAVLSGCAVTDRYSEGTLNLNIVRFAFFTNQSPPTGTNLREFDLPFPLNEFNADRDRRIYFVLGLNRPQEDVPVRIIWYGPQGQVYRTDSPLVTACPTCLWKMIFPSVMTQPIMNMPGEWKVEAFAKNDHVGTYKFKLTSPKMADVASIPQTAFPLSFNATAKAVRDGNAKKALSYYLSLAEAFDKQGQIYNTGFAYALASNVALYSGDYQTAITYAEKSLEIAKALRDHPDLIYDVYLRLVLPYHDIGEFSRVRFYANLMKELAAANYSAPSWPRLLADSHRYLAWAETGLGDYNNAIANLLRAKEIYEKLVNWSVKGPSIVITYYLRCLGALGEAYFLQGDIEQAKYYFRLGHELLRIHRRRGDTLTARIGLGLIALREGDLDGARVQFSNALETSRSSARPIYVARSLHGLARSYVGRGQWKEGISFLKEAVNYLEDMRSSLKVGELRQTLLEGKILVYHDLVSALRALGEDSDAFHYAERGKARAFLDVLGTKVSLSAQQGKALADEEKSLREKLAALQLIGEEGDGEVSRGEIEAAKTEYNEFLTRLRKENAEQASLTTVDPVSLKEVQELLDPTQTLLEYFVTDEKTFLWVVAKDSFYGLTLALPRKQLMGKVNSLRKLISEIGALREYQRTAAELYELLIQPALPHIRGNELIIVPHDVLHYVPFQAIYSPQGKYLIEEYSISYLSSASLLQFTTAKRKAKGEKVLAFGNPDLGDPEKDLQFAELEAGEVRKLYPKSTVFLRKEATEERAKDFSSQYDILHFATHAELKEEDPLSSAVLLAKNGKEDGRLEVREIFGINLNANLVVLSGCETGLGKLSSGDEIVGLTRAFIYAGTPSVIASLWKVDDSSTAGLMGSFYKNLRTMSKVEALRQAQLELIRGEGSSNLLARRGVGGIGKLGEVPEKKSQSLGSVPVSISTSHPYFWAPFILVGDGK